MPRPRAAMRKIREVLRLVLGEGRSRRQVGAVVGLAYTTVTDYVARAQHAGVGWPLPEEMDDTALEARLFPSLTVTEPLRPLPDWGEVHRELRRKGVTLQLLHLEYKECQPEGYQYTQCATRSRARLCQTTPSHRRRMQGSDLGFCPLTLPEHATGAIPWCEASGTTSTAPAWAAAEP